MTDSVKELIDKVGIFEKIVKKEPYLRLVTINELRAMRDTLEIVSKDCPGYQSVIAHVNAAIQRLETK